MDRILNKWYFGLIAIPISINLLTNSIGLPDLFKQWDTTLFASLFFLIIVLTAELILLTKKNKEIAFNPKESDKQIIGKLLAILDVDTFHEDIKNQDSWYGYKQDAIGKTIKFVHAAGLISNRTSDKKLNQILLDLKTAIADFNSCCGTHLYGHGEHWFSPAKNNDINIMNAKIAQPIMNAKAEIAFKKLTLLLDYLRHKNYFE